MSPENGKVVIIAVGVGQTGVATLDELSCINSDLSNIYETVRKVTGSKFDDSRSVCLHNPTRAETQFVIRLISSDINRNDTLLVYYTGHGKQKGSRLMLVFSDAGSGQERGYASETELREWLADCKGESIVILDCCNSGAATSFANRRDIYEHVQISVLASSLPLFPSHFDSEGSSFTQALCSVLRKMHQQGSLLSLNEISRQIKESHGITCLVNVKEGESDVLIPSAPESPLNWRESLAEDFLRRVACSPIVIREALWYALNDVPLRVRLKVLEDFSSNFSQGEPSWLVRRAIGSVLTSCRENIEAWKELVQKFMSSQNWMHQCIGLIGARYDLPQETFRPMVMSIVESSSSRINTLWLAHLYLSDANSDCFEYMLSTKLAVTEWGALDIMRRWAGEGSNTKRLHVLLNKVRDPQVRQAIGTHLRLRSGTNFNQELEFNEVLTRSNLAHCLYHSERKDRTGSISLSAKWLLSMLYGSWRDQVATDNIGDWLKNHPTQEGCQQLEALSLLPAVEMRMAVFQYFQAAPGMLKPYASAISWGLSDSHPWVRREAIRTLSPGPEQIRKICSERMDMTIYPGVCDLLLEVKKILPSCCDDHVDLNANEKWALDWASKLETH